MNSTPQENAGIIPNLMDALGKELDTKGYDIVDLVPIPARVDRMVRIRTLEDTLDEFDRNSEQETMGYLIQVRPKSAPKSKAPTAQTSASASVSSTAATAAPQGAMDGIYTGEGSLNIPFLLQNAELLFHSGEYVLARNIYRAVLKTGERSALPFYWLGRCYEGEGKLEEACRNYEESITYHPTLDTYQRLAALLIRNKKDLQAADALERALNLKEISASTRLEIYKACGNCWMRAERNDKAEASFSAALAIEPANDTLHANLGALHLQSGKIAEAKRHFQAAIAANPRNDKALSGLGSCGIAENDKRAAHDCFARALDVQLANPTAVFYLVKCAYELKTYATAARILGEYVQSAPVNANLMYSLAGLQFHLGRKDEARTTAQKTLELQKDHAGATELLKIISQAT